MVMMENYRLAKSSFRELWHEIERCHLSYLEMEESPEKMDQRVKLEEYILEFLCIAGNSQKFCFSETEDVLKQSAFYKKDFSGYKAAMGFNAIQLYAGNLLSQPWRKEYRQIKTYCGFYKHQIEANLVGAERMFEAMGYQLHGDRLLVLEGPICPDRVKAVSKDCLVAYVECQIWKVIWEELSTAYKASWCEILEFRKNHVCDPEQAVKALKYKQQQRHYQDRTFNQGGYDDASCARINRPFPPPNNHSNVVVAPPAAHDSRFAAPGCCANYSGCFGPAYGYVTYADASSRPALTSNGFYNGFAAAQPFQPYAVPTANLIEVESQVAVSPYAPPDRHAHKSRPSEYLDDQTYRPKNNNVPNTYPTTEESSDKNGDAHFEDWEYVYRNLENQGYSKDLGERGDLLSERFAKETTKKIKATDLDAALNNLVVTERSKYSEAVKGKTVDKQTSPGSSYDNLVHPKKLATKTLPRDKTVSLADRPSNARPSNSRTLDSPKPKEEKNKKKTTPVKSTTDRWHCKACTYLNEIAKDICEMCGKSRTAALDDRPIEVGGAECSKCTLVNAKGRTVCEACGASLVGSPTYI